MHLQLPRGSKAVWRGVSEALNMISSPFLMQADMQLAWPCQSLPHDDHWAWRNVLSAGVKCHITRICQLDPLAQGQCMHCINGFSPTELQIRYITAAKCLPDLLRRLGYSTTTRRNWLM